VPDNNSIKKLPEYAEGKNPQTLGSDILLPAVLAHELRTPIGAVQGFASLIAQEAYGEIGDKRYIDAARQMIQACQHMESVVANVLEVAKQHSVDDRLNEVDADLYELIETSQNWLQDKIVEAKVVVRARVPLTTICARVDERRMRQAILNILDNAIKYTPSGGHIDVEITVDDAEGIEISVTNDLPKENRGRSHASSMAVIGGFGLGLYITRCQLKAHGGDMAIYPTSEGRAKASLLLPIDRKVVCSC